ncbi:hypothetical protein DPEC_G00101810 [Dallia pectoralis]|uniref:Uncharacterized protein n=1 Tax=Dallia pectoralis TaxID=75939 RepID=A0ACC2GXV7_DALPE|nr:hypothetical protein DPEC_G00101810 [Dallia pectoralis]
MDLIGLPPADIIFGKQAVVNLSQLSSPTVFRMTHCGPNGETSHSNFIISRPYVPCHTVPLEPVSLLWWFFEPA